MDEKKEQVKKLYDNFAKEYDEIFLSGRLNLLKQLNFYIIDSILRKNKVHKILDAGGATGLLTEHLAKRGYDITIIDISEKMIMKARENAQEKLAGYKDNIHFIVGDLENVTQIQDATFDFILYDGGTLSYLEHPADGLKEVHRMLKHGGIALITAQNKYYFMGQAKSFNIGMFINRRGKVPDYMNDISVVTTCYTPKELNVLLCDCGLVVEKVGSKIVTIEFMSSVRDQLLNQDDKYFNQVLNLEKRFLWEQSLAGVGRTLMALCRKK